MQINGGTVTFTNCNIHNNQADVSALAPFGSSNAPLDSRLLLCLQGGGVLILSGTVTFTSCNIYQNTAGNVSALAPFGSSNAPDWTHDYCCACREEAFASMVAP